MKRSPCRGLASRARASAQRYVQEGESSIALTDRGSDGRHWPSLHLGPALPAQLRGLDGKVVDADLRQVGAEHTDELLEICDHDRGGLAGGFVEVVVARIHHHRRRGGRRDDSLRVAHHLVHLRAAEAMVEHRKRRHVLGQGVPQTDARAPREDDRAGRRRRRLERPLERLDVLLEEVRVLARDAVPGEPAPEAGHEHDDQGHEPDQEALHLVLTRGCGASAPSDGAPGRPGPRARRRPGGGRGPAAG